MRRTPPRPLRGPRPAASGDRRQRESGAVAVEFALVMPILLLFLFGIVQYGYGLFQLQAFNSAIGGASQLAATGITDCLAFDTTVHGLVRGNGLDATDLSSVQVHWLTADGRPTDKAVPLGLAQVTATIRPFTIGAPFIPFPRTFTVRQSAPISDTGTPSLTGCTLTS